MTPHRSGPGLRALGPLLLVALPAAAREPAVSSTPFTTVNGRVVDLATDGAGNLLFCTAERNVGRIDSTGTVTILADAATGPFPRDLRAVLATPGGDVAVLDLDGDILVLPGGATPATLLYDDLYMILDASDFVIDENGSFVIASSTPSNGRRGMNHVSANGGRWAYYSVEYSPIALAADPLTGGLLQADQTGGGVIRLVDVTDDTHPAPALDAGTLPGFSSAVDDGDLACEADGDFFFVAGGTVWRHDRGADSTTVFASGFGTLRGATIAPSSAGAVSPSGWSLFVAEGAQPTTLHELPDVGAPASQVAADTGVVPNRGQQRLFWGSIKVFGMTSDDEGNLLVGGDLFGSNYQVRRVAVPSMTVTTVADQSNGLPGRIKDLDVAPDGTIYAGAMGGAVLAIRENPLSVQSVFADTQNQIASLWSLALDEDGTIYVGDREGFGPGEVLAISGGVATSLVSASEARGLANDPFSDRIFVTEWNNTGFDGSVSRLDVASLQLTDVPGFERINYSNSEWGDGDVTVDAAGGVYTCSKDDWRVTRYDPDKERFATIGSSYLHNPTGLAIAESTPGSGSTTGWSLYVAEQDFLWEIPSTPPPAARRIDRGLPAGRFAGFLSRFVGEPRALLADPAGGGLLVATSLGTLERVDPLTGQVTRVAGAPQGLAGDLTALARTPDGTVVVAARDGRLYEVDPAAGYQAFVRYDDAADLLDEVRGVAVDGLGRVVVSEHRSGKRGGRVLRLVEPAFAIRGVDPNRAMPDPFEDLARTARGLRVAVDPLTGDVFATQQGSGGDVRAEVLRVTSFETPAAYGHYKGASYFTFDCGPADGGLAFADDGTFYVVEGEAGVVRGVDRATGQRFEVGANYVNPLDATLAPGTPGTAGAQGASLFVLDGWALYEIGVDGAAPAALPTDATGIEPIELRTRGFLELLGSTSFEIEAPSEPGAIHVIFATTVGKVPGIPTCGGLLPSNPGGPWVEFVQSPNTANFVGVLDANGLSSGIEIFGLSNPALFSLDLFVDMVWVKVELPLSGCFFARIGGTTQVYVGD